MLNNTRISGRGIFTLHPSLTILYYRLLGAKIGQDVHMDENTKLFECDLLDIQDGCRLHTSSIRGFCVETNGYFTLAPVTIGRKVFVNAYTNINPGSRLADGSVYGPHASSYDDCSPKAYAAYNGTLLRKPSLVLQILVAWPIILAVIFLSCKSLFNSNFIVLCICLRYSVDGRHLCHGQPDACHPSWTQRPGISNLLVRVTEASLVSCFFQNRSGSVQAFD